MSEFVQYLVNGLTIGAFLALIALGYSMIYGVVRLINFAHGDVFMIGAFAGFGTLTTLGATGGMALPAVLAAVAVGALTTGVVGTGIARAAYVPLLSSPRLALLIAAIGVSLALEEGVKVLTHARFKSYPNALDGGQIFSGAVRVTYGQLALVLLSLALMAALWLFVTRTVTGTAMRALAMDRDAARLQGINVERLILATFFVGSLLAGAAGVMYGLYYVQISFGMGFLIGLRAFTAAVLGGIGNLPGTMVAGVAIGLVQSFSAGYVSSRWTDVIIFGLLIAVLALRPTGLFGERVVERA
ncbi:amino acid/amide ABC transporter membrane protein 1, HAAT family [Actinomadura meyerae]|uniref:Amino acid/amide ABC transporter membrane protein 1, HAAT family n=1 Tax=Actinomadura meyerae TaxID=240840 RepID=A0A239P2U1_9ACTN|nr:branched-chain amino acid ABC transporter permease [Actinomadura meyerae]SNT60948.1 amino acid/amide ABC transporter membrane protein 1, HAAT family [Actinomadura meyerae]